MKFTIATLFSIFLFSLTSSAGSGHSRTKCPKSTKHCVAEKNIKFEKKLRVGGIIAWVIITDDHHAKDRGMKFYTEVRPDCKNSGKHWQSLTPLDGVASCEVDSKDIFVDKKRDLIKIGHTPVDSDYVNEQTRKNPIARINYRCKKDAKQKDIIKIYESETMKNLCLVAKENNL